MENFHLKDSLENVDLVSKHIIIMASKKPEHRCTLHETIRVKSGARNIIGKHSLEFSW